MKYRWFFILIGVLIILVVFLIIQVNISKRTPYKKPFAEKKVTGIKIVRQKKTIRLEKKNEKWTLTEPIKYKASNAVMERIEKQLSKFTVMEPITSDKKKFGLFRVEDNDTKLWVFTDKDSTGFILGKAAGGGSYYLRYVGGYKVFVSSGLPFSTFDQKLSYWREKKFLEFNKDSLDSLILTMGRKKNVFKKDKENNWTVNKKSIEKNEVQSIINQLSNFSCDDFIDTLKTFEKKIGIDVFLKGGEEHNISIGKEREKRFPLKIDTNPTTFIINSYKAEKFIKFFK